ncbi:MAG TPA: C39 family peptidase [Anaerolineaceae bacterium]
MYHRKSSVPSLLLGMALALAGFCILGWVLYQIPQINEKVAWRVEYALINVKSWFNPVEAMPTALPTPLESTTLAVVDAATPTPPAATPTAEFTATPTPELSPTPTLTPTAVPEAVKLEPPTWEKEDLNACGPATLSMYLRFYGWKGDQKTISDEIKPIRADRNVNVEELMFYARNRSGWLLSDYRVGGTTETLKRFIAAGIPIMVESGFKVEKTFWANDDRWVGHYLLLTGYDDATQTFITQDSEKGANIRQTYDQLDRDWQIFNRVYIYVYPPEQEQTVREILGEDWDADVNRQNALETAQRETEEDPKNGFAWFNLGSNLTYFERYTEAAAAYDEARKLNLPQRMLRYQFGPFIAYFHTNRIDDLSTLADYALQITANAEEALLWKGWALYRQGKRDEAIASFQKALEARPGYGDAQYALNWVMNN